jgi:hypothetical protein
MCQPHSHGLVNTHPEAPASQENLAAVLARTEEAGRADRFTTISLQSAPFSVSERKGRAACLYDNEITSKRMVGLEGFEPPTHGLGNLVPLLAGFEKSGLYCFRQRVTNSMIPGRVLDLTRFEQRPTTDSLQRAPESSSHAVKPQPFRRAPRTVPPEFKEFCASISTRFRNLWPRLPFCLQ